MNLGLKKLIAEIALSSSIKEAAELYKMFEGILKDYVFILSFDKSSAAIPGLAVDKNFSKTGAIRGLYKYNKCLTVRELNTILRMLATLPVGCRRPGKQSRYAKFLFCVSGTRSPPFSLR
ncbi:hypothetical protein APC05_25875 [Acinetobacter pittii]|nr:hypothetical protein APC05_25875 [Acinetobacter pittii]